MAYKLGSENKDRRSAAPAGTAVPVAVYIEDRHVVITLSDGETLKTRLSLHPWLANATPEEQANYKLGSYSIDWPALDEGLDIAWIRSHQTSQLGSVFTAKN